MSAKPYMPPLENAHDVRNLRICPICKQMGNIRCMPDGKHGRCIIKKEGIEGLLKLGKAEYGKAALADIGCKSAIALLNAWRAK